MRRYVISVLAAMMLLVLALPASAGVDEGNGDNNQSNGDNNKSNGVNNQSGTNEPDWDNNNWGDDVTPPADVPPIPPADVPPIPPAEVIFAVAYTDVNELDGRYNPAVDVLIAKLIDGNRDGVLNAGDLVITDRYPKGFDGSSFGSFTRTSHTIDSLLAAGPSLVSVSVGLRSFHWFADPGREAYEEALDYVFTFIGDFQFGSEEILVDSMSPSAPDTSGYWYQEDVRDNAFVDVEIHLP